MEVVLVFGEKIDVVPNVVLGGAMRLVEGFVVRVEANEHVAGREES